MFLFFLIVSVRQLGHKKENTEKEKKMRQPFAALLSYINIYICGCIQLYIYPSPFFSSFSLLFRFMVGSSFLLCCWIDINLYKIMKASGRKEQKRGLFK